MWLGSTYIPKFSWILWGMTKTLKKIRCTKINCVHIASYSCPCKIAHGSCAPRYVTMLHGPRLDMTRHIEDSVHLFWCPSILLGCVQDAQTRYCIAILPRLSAQVIGDGNNWWQKHEKGRSCLKISISYHKPSKTLKTLHPRHIHHQIIFSMNKST